MVPRVVFLLLAWPLFSGCLGEEGPTRSEALLLSAPYSSLLVEIDYVAGREPQPEALEALRQALDAYTEKKSIVLADPTQIPVQSEDPDQRDLRAIHGRYADLMKLERGEYGRGELAYLHVIYMNGRFQGSTSTTHSAGSTLRDDSVIFIFPDAFEHAFRIVGSQKADASTEVEASVILHELGHAFGLVGQGVPETRPHSDGAGHSKNSGSVMTRQLAMASGGLISSNVPRDFDADDKADLARFIEANS